MTISGDNPEGTPIFENTRQSYGEAEVVAGAEPPVGSTFLTGSDESGTAGTTSDTSKTEVAKDEAGRVADSAKDAAVDVAEVAKDEAAIVAHEAQLQAKQLYHQTQSELREQAAVQQQRVADGLRSIGDELQQMARSSEQQGVASDLVGQAATRTQSVARWLDERDPGSLLREVKSYARRNPGTFIAAAALTGVLAGRLTRALASGGDDSGTAGSGTAGSTAGSTAVPASEGYVPGGTMGDESRSGGSL
ncbi:hypothetical protein ASF88_12440 [Leifsonia sp. Leaf336]|uniref:hypothetical protein n=1 Tax=Leifsonia sp. Leaf336 TaxID=1736341 RepID=UPI0006FD4504|nr:hypothetical protein [Leifsonia sp. Leaf336]KQR52351.1 hypothetical protein ASF88_12440 [Leifsonia sp. Leaf336]